MGTSRDAVLILTAAGLSQRFGRPKLLEVLNGRPLFTYPDLVFSRYSFKEKIITIPLALKDQFLPVITSFLPDYRVVYGETSRARSVRAAVRSSQVQSESILIHDAARPLLTTAVMDSLFGALLPGVSCVVPGLAVVDTIKQVDEFGVVSQTVPRRSLRAIQTPQLVLRSALLTAYEMFGDDVLDLATDEAMLIEDLGEKVTVIAGDQRSLKITEPEDLLSLRRYLSE